MRTTNSPPGTIAPGQHPADMNVGNVRITTGFTHNQDRGCGQVGTHANIAGYGN